jgi:hypothetical protein
MRESNIRLGAKLGKILKNSLIIREASKTWRLRTSSKQPILQKISLRSARAEEHFFPFSFLPSTFMDLSENPKE